MNDNWLHLPFPNEYVKMITELLRASFSVLITSNGSASELLAAKNNMIDSENRQKGKVNDNLFAGVLSCAYIGLRINLSTFDTSLAEN